MDDPFVPHDPDISRLALTRRLARRVREVRKQKGLPRRIISEISGVSPRYLAQLEAGEGNISITLLERVARALEVPIEALIAKTITVDSDAQRMAHLYERASDDVRAKIKALLQPERPTSSREGRICLIGMRGAGKSTLGAFAADALGLPFIELNTLIEKETGMPLGEVLSLYGADGFRRLEAEALERVSRQTGPVLLCVSSGLVEQEAPFARLLTQFHTVWIHASVSEYVERMQGQISSRPIRKTPATDAQIQPILDARAQLYGRATAQLDTSGRSVEVSMQELVALIADNKFT